VVGGAYVFGFATLPALLATGWLGERLSSRARGRGLRVAGALLAAFGVLTIFRGADTVHAWFHRHALPADAAGAHEGHGAAGEPAKNPSEKP
jgi:sulfite exporter TauE/SafE